MPRCYGSGHQRIVYCSTQTWGSLSQEKMDDISGDGDLLTATQTVPSGLAVFAYPCAPCVRQAGDASIAPPWESKHPQEAPCIRNARSVVFSSMFRVAIRPVTATITPASARCVGIVRTTSGGTDTFCTSVPHCGCQVCETWRWIGRVRQTGTISPKERPA